MKITNVEVFPVAPKTNYVKISTDEGICGWGEPVVEGRRGSVAAAVLELKPLLLGKNPENIEDLFYLMYRGNFYKGGPVLMSAISGVEQALWDIKGKAYQKPVYQLIGGAAKEKQRVYAWVHGDTPEELGEAAKRRLKQGYRYIKTCVTHQMEWIDSNSAITKAGDMMGGIRDAVGDQLEVGVDFHGRVHKSMAAKMMKEMEQYNVLFVEEPVLPGNEEALIELHRVANIPIATGERLFGRWDFKRILQLGAVDIIQPDLSHAGGIWEVRKIAAMAEAFDVAVAPHCPLGVIAFSACLHLDVATPNSFVQEQIIGAHNCVNGAPFVMEEKMELADGRSYFLTNPYVKNPEGLFTFENGYLHLPKNPGLGFEIDDEQIREDSLRTDLPQWAQPVWRQEDGTMTEW